MTAVNTNDSHLHRLPKTQLWIPLLSSENRTLLNDCLFFLLTIFSQWLFFSAHGYGFSVRVPKQRLLRRGWDGSQNGFPKSPARGFRFWFLHTVFLGGKGMGTTCTSAFFFKFYSVHSTAHGKPLVVDSSSYV
jgi:hypothetical protein